MNILIKSRHVSRVIFDQRPGPGIVETIEPHRHFKKNSPTPHHGLLIFMNYLWGSEGLEFDVAGFQPGAAEEARRRGGFTQRSITVVAPSIRTGGIRW